MQTYAFILNNVVTKIETCSEDSYLSQAHDYQNIADVTDMLPQPQVGWLLVDSKLLPPVALSNTEKDMAKFLKRSKVRDIIIAEMATENMARVRAGTWSVGDLTSLTQDAELKLLLDDVNTLSYELAVQKVQVLSNPLITSAIKSGWISKLMTNFYN